MSTNKKAVVLLSGGLDSTTTLAIAKNMGYEIYAITFRYGQRHEFEISAAERIAQEAGVKEHAIIGIDLQKIGGSALTADIAVPKSRNSEEISEGIPITYVPARNTIFLSFALALAEVKEASDIFIGVTAVDYSGYPDCRPEYIAAYEKMANLATKASVEGKTHINIQTPLLHLSKSQIIQKGLDLGVDYGRTHSCYDPAADGAACGQCDACLLRLKGFAQLGLEDPRPYLTRGEFGK